MCLFSHTSRLPVSGEVMPLKQRCFVLANLMDLSHQRAESRLFGRGFLEVLEWLIWVKGVTLREI
jgi:hypothetical protein